ncbi:hypothetical protein ACROYT_G040292 [Oculina patagonica]
MKYGLDMEPMVVKVKELEVLNLDEEDENDSSFFCPPEAEDPPQPSASFVLCCVSTKQSSHFNAFYRHHPLKLTLDTGSVAIKPLVCYFQVILFLFLVPSSSITFICQLYTSSISDWEIIEHCGFQRMPFEAGDCLMVDKGFDI